MNKMIDLNFTECFKHYQKNKNSKIYECADGCVLFNQTFNQNIMNIYYIEIKDSNDNKSFVEMIKYIDKFYDTIILVGYGNRLNELGLNTYNFNDKKFFNIQGDGILQIYIDIKKNNKKNSNKVNFHIQNNEDFLFYDNI